MPNSETHINLDSNGDTAFQGACSNRSQESTVSSPLSDLRQAPEKMLQDEANMALYYKNALKEQNTDLLPPPSSLVSNANHSSFGFVSHGNQGRVGGSTTYQEVRDPGGHDTSPGEKAEASDASGHLPPVSAEKQQEPVNMSDGSGNSGNVVTATGNTTTTTTSSGDDPDSSWGISMPKDERNCEGMKLHHHHHRSRRRVHESDGSALQVPGAAGFHRLPGGSAAVVAARLPPPNSDTTTNVPSSGSGGEAAESPEETLLQPHREPGYHTIRKTFSKLPKRGEGRLGGQRCSATDSSSTQEEAALDRTKSPRSSSGKDAQHDSTKTKKSRLTSKKTSFLRRRDPVAIRFRDLSPVDGRESPSPDSVGSSSGDGEGSSSGSGTEGGYTASASSNDNSGQQESSSSSEDSRSKSKRHRSRTKVPKRSESGSSCSSSSSSEIADFSSGASMMNEEHAVGLSINAFHESVPYTSPSLPSAKGGRLDDLEQTYLFAKKTVEEDQLHFLKATTKKRKSSDIRTWSRKAPARWPRPELTFRNDNSKLDRRPPILKLGSDVMAHVLTFLHPPDILEVLTMPLSKEWRQTFTLQPELWRVLCLVEPFKAIMDDNDSGASEDSFSSNKIKQRSFHKGLLDRYRLLYTSFVRCMKYLSQIREDALSGREPTFIDYGGIAERGRSSKRGPPMLLGSNRNLQLFLARARGVVDEAKSHSESNSSRENESNMALGVARVSAGHTSAQKRSARRLCHDDESKKKKPKLGKSMITDRLLGPSQDGEPGSLTLPWSCAIYSIVNWMVAFLDVEGIQILCLKVLPFLLEDEKQRMTAQRTGLTDVILRTMVLFENSVELHIAAFHTIVLLARPLGGKEGMLFHSSMVASGIFGGQTFQHRKNGIAVMVDSMRRFEGNEILQAMSCWALVNIALAPTQKAVLVKLGGIQATLNAMLHHPFNAEVQFRALFALINLVIPSISLNSTNSTTIPMQGPRGDANNRTTEKEIIDELVGEIGKLVVQAMTNFCSSEAILNRACLVLHNLSLTPGYHETLLWTPNCYQMLEWCLANYRTDQVLQQSASGTLNRLQTTLSSNDNLRTRFADSLNAQHRRSLQKAHNEAVRLNEQVEPLNGQGAMNQLE